MAQRHWQSRPPTPRRRRRLQDRGHHSRQRYGDRWPVRRGSFLTGGGFPAVDGWNSTIAGPNLTEDPAIAEWVNKYTQKYGKTPDDYAITAYDGALVVLDAIKRVAETGKPVTRSNVRDAMQTTNLKTLQGVVSFDENGDITD